MFHLNGCVGGKHSFLYVNTLVNFPVYKVGLHIITLPPPSSAFCGKNLSVHDNMHIRKGGYLY